MKIYLKQLKLDINFLNIKKIYSFVKIYKMMKMKEKLEYRMYSLVIYQLSGIQAGIQAGHAVEEFYDEYKDTNKHKKYRKDKTWIVLNGGTSNSGKESYYGLPKEIGTMEQHLNLFVENGIECAPFYEPDLNYCLTAIAFLVDERVFDKEKYPNFIDYILDIKMYASAKTQISAETYVILKTKTIEELNILFPEYYTEWIDFIGGEKNEFLREFLKDKKLA
jgi:hypothetical protein